MNINDVELFINLRLGNLFFFIFFLFNNESDLLIFFNFLIKDTNSYILILLFLFLSARFKTWNF